MAKKRPTTDKPKSPTKITGLVGLPFQVWGSPTAIKHQGKVIAKITDDVYLIVLVEGITTALHLVPLASMIAGSLERGAGMWEFVDDE